MLRPHHPHLPYQDTKPTGAVDFYFVINATFHFITRQLGAAALRDYWRDLGTRYYAPVTAMWKRGGLSAVADYWQDFFSAEPGADVRVTHEADAVILDVQRCPAIAHLRAHHRQIHPAFCQHCYFVSQAIAAPAGLTVRIHGGNGTCRQSFTAASPDDDPQDLIHIREATSL